MPKKQKDKDKEKEKHQSSQAIQKDASDGGVAQELDPTAKCRQAMIKLYGPHFRQRLREQIAEYPWRSRNGMNEAMNMAEHVCDGTPAGDILGLRTWGQRDLSKVLEGIDKNLFVADFIEEVNQVVGDLVMAARMILDGDPRGETRWKGAMKRRAAKYLNPYLYYKFGANISFSERAKEAHQYVLERLGFTEPPEIPADLPAWMRLNPDRIWGAVLRRKAEELWASGAKI